MAQVVFYQRSVGGEKMKKSWVISALIVALLFSFFSFGMTLVAADEPAQRWVKVGDLIEITSRRGLSVSAENSKISRENASLTLTVQVTEVGERWFKFRLHSGTIEIEGTKFVISWAEGGVRRERGGAFITIRGSVQDNNGESVLRGRVILRGGRMIVMLVGQLAVGDTLYGLRFLAVARKR